MNLNKRDAWEFYITHIYREDLFQTCKRWGFTVQGIIHSKTWELFGSILTGDRASPGGSGSDLENFEVKSRCMTDGNKKKISPKSFTYEYQYHRRNGVDKLYEEMRLTHIYVQYSENYRDIIVKMVEGHTLIDVFYSWLPDIKKRYNIDLDIPLLTGHRSLSPMKERCRKYIRDDLVDRMGKTIMVIRDTSLIEDESNYIPQISLFG